MLTTVQSNGLIQNWFQSKNESISEISYHVEDQNPITAANYSCDGQNFTVAAKDLSLYIYDISTSQLKATMCHDRKVAGHSNIISCVKHHPTDANLVVTGSWDSTVKIYDIRAKIPICSMKSSGPITGNSIDIFEDMIVAGSYKSSENCMQMFSMKYQQLVHEWSYN